MLSIPRQVGAGFFSSILNNQVYAQNSDLNSQNMPLLQPNISPVSLLASKNSQNSKKDDKEDAPVDQNSSIKIVDNNSLLPTTSLTGSSNGNDVEDFSFDQTSIYVVKNGDTVSRVADMYGISADTILTANDIKKGEKLKEGDILLILPFSGLEHTVLKGQTLKSIAALYKVDLNEILLANDGIDIDTVLTIGEKLIIPGAEISNEPTQTPKAKSVTTIKGNTSQSSLPSVSGYFKLPVQGARRTRGLQASPRHQGVDFAAPIGTSIHAAASGTVIIARNGYNGGFGNYVVIQHSNGMKTLYAHMSKLGTTTGEKVSQGEVIGYVGNTGDSSGNHLHIEVLGGKNPF